MGDLQNMYIKGIKKEATNFDSLFYQFCDLNQGPSR